MAQKNYTQYALLGLLVTGYHTGYSMKQMIDGSLNHFWKISYGQIYPALKQLVDKGYAEVKITSQQGKPDKKEYYITSSGKDFLKQWLQQPVQELPIEKNELLLKLFFSRQQDKSTTIAQIENYYEKLVERSNTYECIKKMILTESSEHKDAPFWIITLDYGLSTTHAAMDWCIRTKDTLLNLKEE
ncbi:PadR family transcriptional regulator [Thalassobacillus pellis]|uniref:PadR family transcriptional regulator n=1 Tax=Thalassobacillus pellis TaxID=748008 RepID=UPI0019600615|nr:PadR family transcriptional regulator [Thalassobacillus pellis]MBM7553217.1 DNA-binding PadR family transcriptional regulator [Thalassobacillus pellis]